jgi:tRNA A-37 threonylcarbamoyl transferase component Bud32
MCSATRDLASQRRNRITMPWDDFPDVSELPSPRTYAGLDPCDDLVVRLVAGRANLGPDGVRHLLDWWRAERRPGERLADFLTYERIFSRATLDRLDAVGAGRAEPADLPEEEVLRLCNRLRQLDEIRRKPTSTVNLVLPPVEPGPPAADMSPSRPDLPEPPDTPFPAKPLNLPLDNPAGGGELRVGAVLSGRYLLEELIGEGASSRVYRARHRHLDMPVAIKVLQVAASERYAGVHRKLKDEARLLARLNHPNVVRVIDFDETDRYPYCVLEYIEGWNLADLIDQQGRLRPDIAAGFVLRVAEGLAAAHSLGILHRDVKPANILITPEGTAKLVDLGLAVLVPEDPAGEPRRPVAGTMLYMAPEVASRGAVDHRADIYSLGVSFYHAVTGVPPFAGGSPWEVIHGHAEEPAVPPHDLVPVIPIVSNVILRMMAKRPDDRYPDYRSLLADLSGLLMTLRLLESGREADWDRLDPRPYLSARTPGPFWKRWFSRSV